MYIFDLHRLFLCMQKDISLFTQISDKQQALYWLALGHSQSGDMAEPGEVGNQVSSRVLDELQRAAEAVHKDRV